MSVNGTHGTPLNPSFLPFNGGFASAGGSFRDLLLFRGAVTTSIGNVQFVPFVTPSSGYTLDILNVLNISIPADGSPNLSLGEQILLIPPNPAAPLLSVFAPFLTYDPSPNIGFQVNTGTVSGFSWLTTWAIPAGTGTVAFGETAILQMQLNPGTGTFPSSTSSTFSDPIQFEVLDPNGNIVPNLVVQSALGLQYSVVDGFVPTSGVPEPSTWAMMLLGFAGLGFAFRHSRRKVSFA